MHIARLRDEVAHCRRLAAGPISFAVAGDLERVAAYYERRPAALEDGLASCGAMLASQAADRRLLSSVPAEQVSAAVRHNDILDGKSGTDRNVIRSPLDIDLAPFDWQDEDEFFLEEPRRTDDRSLFRDFFGVLCLIAASLAVIVVMAQG